MMRRISRLVLCSLVLAGLCGGYECLRNTATAQVTIKSGPPCHCAMWPIIEMEPTGSGNYMFYVEGHEVDCYHPDASYGIYPLSSVPDWPYSCEDNACFAGARCVVPIFKGIPKGFKPNPHSDLKMKEVDDDEIIEFRTNLGTAVKAKVYTYKVHRKNKPKKSRIIHLAYEDSSLGAATMDVTRICELEPKIYRVNCGGQQILVFLN